jgi:hypothetical protein
VALGWAVAPFTIAITLTGAWAANTRKESEKKQKFSKTSLIQATQNQRSGNNAKQVQVGRDLRITGKDK